MVTGSCNYRFAPVLHWFCARVLCCDRFDRGSRQTKRAQVVDMVMEDYDVSLCQQFDRIIQNGLERTYVTVPISGKALH